MKDKVIELAILQPYAYPWDKSELGLTHDEIYTILESVNLENEPNRRIAGYELDVISYLNAEKASNYDDLKAKITEKLCERAYISEILIDRILHKKYLANNNELTIYKRFINNNLTIEEKKNYVDNIELWLVDLVYYYNTGKVGEHDTEVMRDEIFRIIKENYQEIKRRPFFIDKLRKSKALNRSYILDIVHIGVAKYNLELEMLLKKYLKESNKNNNSEVNTFEDDLFDIINEIPTFDLNEEDTIASDLVESVQKEVETVNVQVKDTNIECNKKEVVLETQKTTTPKNNETELHLKGLAKSLGYKLIKCEDSFVEEDTEISILKELASFKKGAILSELYNAHINFDNISKENLEAIINNFFTSLKLLGFEVDETNTIGEKVKLDTKNLLSEFIMTSSIDEKGLIDAEVKYLPWMYNGKRVTPMVVNPIKK